MVYRLLRTIVGDYLKLWKMVYHGYLVDGRNPKTFAQKCLQLYYNKELYRKMCNASRNRIINEYSVEKMSVKYYEVYNNILNTVS